MNILLVDVVYVVEPVIEVVAERRGFGGVPDPRVRQRPLLLEALGDPDGPVTARVADPE